MVQDIRMGFAPYDTMLFDDSSRRCRCRGSPKQMAKQACPASQLQKWPITCDILKNLDNGVRYDVSVYDTLIGSRLCAFH